MYYYRVSVLLPADCYDIEMTNNSSDGRVKWRVQ